MKSSRKIVNTTVKYNNPIIPGFYPDPSVCRVGGDYYLVTSSFEYFPGIPIFHSRDLVHWEQIGHCLTRKSQLNLTNTPSSLGIFAPSIRYKNGRFYVITTSFKGQGHFYVYTDDPYGEWSEPVYVEGTGFDPDLFFDNNGKVYFIREDFYGHGIRLWEIDIETGKLSGEEKLIWDGFEDKLCEAPHIYKINDYYYLLAAEGGTHRGHMVVAARSKNVEGPYIGCPNNPILSHRCNVMHSIQATGHADLVEDQKGHLWLVFLGIRQVGGYHHLGRETFLSPVKFDENGWPVVNDGRPIELEMEADCLPEYRVKAIPSRDDFDGERLNLWWNFRRNPLDELWSLTERKGFLTIHGQKQCLDDIDFKSFIGRRQQHFNCRVRTLMKFSFSINGQEAGITAIMNEGHHYEIAVSVMGSVNSVIVRKRIGDISSVVYCKPISYDTIYLEIAAKADKYIFSYGESEDDMIRAAEALPKYLSTEVADGFTGVYFGMYASGNNVADNVTAFFDWFDYSYKN
jgi:alpha-N-arabinofuranosidase